MLPGLFADQNNKTCQNHNMKQQTKWYVPKGSIKHRNVEINYRQAKKQQPLHPSSALATVGGLTTCFSVICPS